MEKHASDHKLPQPSAFAAASRPNHGGRLLSESESDSQPQVGSLHSRKYTNRNEI